MESLEAGSNVELVKLLHGKLAMHEEVSRGVADVVSSFHTLTLI